MNYRLISAFVFFWLSISVPLQLLAQTDPLISARVLAERKEYDKAKDAYAKLYNQNPTDADVYKEYLAVLIESKDLKAAEKVVNEQKKIRQHNPLTSIDMGRVYLANGKGKKAEEQFDEAIQMLSGDDLMTQQVANAFTAINRDDYTLKTYERSRDILRTPYFYSAPLSRLYAKAGEIDKAIFTLLDSNPGQYGNLDDTKATMLELLGADAKKIQLAQKAVVKRINEHPENPYFAELLTWLYTQKDDWDGALLQMQALDARNNEHGERLLEFAKLAAREEKYEYAIKAYDAVIEKGKEFTYYNMAIGEKLTVLFYVLKADPTRKKEDIAALEKQYADFLVEFPLNKYTQTIRDYAALEALYANNPQAAVKLLEEVIDQPNLRKDFIGNVKLEMGDYYILMGRIWDASLIYSQVDKAFREDVLGEEARFRNAKLSYYVGDFQWAQGQLSVLKASTTELIANDALYLSVLITENIPPDSNYTPIKRFAHADLLQFQNKDTEAEALLDSIATNFPEHPLKDDILMKKARLAQKHLDYKKALTYLHEIHTKHGEDVLGDDALFTIAEIQEENLKNTTEAEKYYEDLIIQYPGSTYIQSARNRLAALQTTSPVIP